MRTQFSDEHALDWYQTLFEMIDMRSFSNLWFWIALAVMWSTASHWVLGVPFDMVLRARRHGGEAQADLEDIVRINVVRRLGSLRPRKSFARSSSVSGAERSS